MDTFSKVKSLSFQELMNKEIGTAMAAVTYTKCISKSYAKERDSLLGSCSMSKYTGCLLGCAIHVTMSTGTMTQCLVLTNHILRERGTK